MGIAHVVDSVCCVKTERMLQRSRDSTRSTIVAKTTRNSFKLMTKRLIVAIAPIVENNLPISPSNFCWLWNGYYKMWAKGMRHTTF